VFTGLIQAQGKIQPLGNDRFSLTIIKQGYHNFALQSDLSLGDSIAVDGICLTVEEITSDGFIATASPETLQRTTLSDKQQGYGYVNLEASLRVGSKIGGHFVTGHVDGIGCLVDSLSTGNSWELTFSSPPSLTSQWQKYIAPYIVSKGSIAVNGISLTVADCDMQGNWFKVAVIPHTYKETNLSQLKLGDWVNLETDVLGKYVARMISHGFNHSLPQPDITLDFLTEHGYKL
jgi:riboflavin synthase